MATKHQPTVNPATLTDQVRSIITARGLSAHAVAKSAGVHPEGVYRFMADKRGVHSDTLNKICDALGLVVTESRRGLGRK